VLISCKEEIIGKHMASVAHHIVYFSTRKITKLREEPGYENRFFPPTADGQISNLKFSWSFGILPSVSTAATVQ